MIWATIKKHILLFWRNQSQIFLLVGLPLLLIAILGFSLQGMIGTDTISSFNVDIAVMEHEDEQAEVDRFIDTLNQRDVSEDIKKQVRQSAPIAMLKQTVSDELDDTITMTDVEADDVDQVLERDDYDAVIEVPEGFTYHTLASMFSDDQTDIQTSGAPELTVYPDEDDSLRSGAALELINTYKDQLALATYSSKLGIDQEAMAAALPASFGSSKTVGASDPISSKTYYAFAMISMNILFVATSIAMWAYYEREQHIFNRMIISRTSPRQYILGIFVTGTTVGLVQAVGIYVLSLMLLGVGWTDPALFLLVTLALALSVGGLTSLLASVSYRLDSLAVTSLFSSFIISIFAFLGGNFFPVDQYSDIIGMLSNFTPNGAGLTAYLSVMRGDGIQGIWAYVVSLAVSSVVMLFLALGIFPKRGGQV